MKLAAFERLKLNSPFCLFLKLQLTRAYIKSSMSLIGPLSTELDAIACLKNIY